MEVGTQIADMLSVLQWGLTQVHLHQTYILKIVWPTKTNIADLNKIAKLVKFITSARADCWSRDPLCNPRAPYNLYDMMQDI